MWLRLCCAPGFLVGGGVNGKKKWICQFFKRYGEDVSTHGMDCGVDAVGFDPDPIRGGKIVIQAKRYTNTVVLSAVRDFYGTVQVLSERENNSK